jgi:hypothetical protein
MYEGITTKIHSLIGHDRNFGAEQLVILQNYLRSVITQYGFAGQVKTTLTDAGRTVPTYDDVFDYVWELTTSVYGEQLNARFLAHQLINWAVTIRTSTPDLFVIVQNASLDLAEIMPFAKKTSLFLSGSEDIDESYVAQKLGIKTLPSVEDGGGVDAGLMSQIEDTTVGEKVDEAEKLADETAPAIVKETKKYKKNKNNSEQTKMETK